MTTGPGDEEGFTLLEVLVAMALIGLGGVAVLGALWWTITSSVLQSELAAGELELRNLAEHVKDAPYAPCQEDPLPDYGAGFVGDDDAVAVDGIEFWTGAVDVSRPFSAACPGEGDQGAQLVTLRLTITLDEDENRTRETYLEVVKRDEGQ